MNPVLDNGHQACAHYYPEYFRFYNLISLLEVSFRGLIRCVEPAGFSDEGRVLKPLDTAVKPRYDNLSGAKPFKRCEVATHCKGSAIPCDMRLLDALVD